MVVRDARDVFMSFWNHSSSYTETTYALHNDPATLHGPPMPRCPADIHVFWDAWINRGWFAGESEGYPHSANLGHTQSWWDFRHLDNILFVHFNDLLADLAGEIGRVAAFLGDPGRPGRGAAPGRGPRLRGDQAQRRAGGADAAGSAPAIFVGGLASFFFKGTNGRWRDVLRPEELAMLEQAKARVMTPGLRRLHGARPRRAPVELRPVSRHVRLRPRPRPGPDAGPRQRAPRRPRVGQLFLGGSLAKSVA